MKFGERGVFSIAFLAAIALGLAISGTVQALHPVDDYNVVWDNPSEGPVGSMPIGNGDIALNVWVEGNGDLLFYIAKNDSWSENGRLLKLGRVRVKLSPNPFANGLPFRQELKLHEGEIEIAAGEAGSEVTIRVWVDANNTVVEGTYSNGKLERLNVTPESRTKDVVNMLQG